MAVPNVPFYMSQANQEFLGTPVGNISDTMRAAGVPIPGNVSSLGGKSSSTHSLTVGYISGTENYEYGIPYHYYGFTDGSVYYDYDYSPGANPPVGELTPRTIPGENSSIVITSLGSMEQDWWLDGNYVCDGDGTSYASINVGNVPNLWIKFPNGAVFQVRTNGSETTSSAHNTFKSYVNQTIGITLSTSPL